MHCTENILETISPEQAGIHSSSIAKFIDTLDNRGLPLHSFIMLRHGKIFAEGYYSPLSSDKQHRMYSSTKTFVSMAIGMLRGEGKLSLDDSIAQYFPEHLPSNPHPYIMEMTIRDLLMMATPFPYNTYGEFDRDWVHTFFNAEPKYPAGTLFMYNTSATVVLNALVEKLSGIGLLEYLRPRLFEPLGMSPDIRCIERPEGGTWGGSGLLCTSRDLAKFALCLCGYGNFRGIQLIPEHYVREAVSKQIDNSTGSNDTVHGNGYGYQIWCMPHEGFATLGMGGQIAFCLPEQDFVMVTTGDTQHISNGYSDVFHAMWDFIYPELAAEKILPENPNEYDALRKKLSSLSLYHPHGAAHMPDTEKRVGGVTYLLNENQMNISRIRFDFGNDTVKMSYTNAGGNREIVFGADKYINGEFPEHYYGKQIGIRSNSGYDCTSCCVWADEYTMLLNVCIIDDYFGTMHAHITFLPDGRLTMYMTKTAEWFLNEYQGIAEGHAAF